MSNIDPTTTGQIVPSAAETYEAFFVPALFAQWPDRLLEAAGLMPGDDVLDVGCGTGVLARAAARRLDGSGSITGVDNNAGMLSVARRAPEPVTWHSAAAESLPFPDRSFDRVVSQFALMFFTDQTAALAEMARVTRPGGTITIATWAAIDQSPGYSAMVELLQRLFGNETAAALTAPFTIGTDHLLRATLHDVLPNATIERYEGVARFDSLEAWVHTDIRAWTLADTIDEDQYSKLLAAARTELAEFVDDHGRVQFAAPALIATSGIWHESPGRSTR